MNKYNIIYPAWGDWLKIPDNEECWLECPICLYKPRIWEFDNGRYAYCACSKDYSIYFHRKVEAESIMSYVTKNNGSVLVFDFDELRKNWNKLVSKLEKESV